MLKFTGIFVSAVITCDIFSAATMKHVGAEKLAQFRT